MELNSVFIAWPHVPGGGREAGDRPFVSGNGDVALRSVLTPCFGLTRMPTRHSESRSRLKCFSTATGKRSGCVHAIRSKYAFEFRPPGERNNVKVAFGSGPSSRISALESNARAFRRDRYQLRRHPDTGHDQNHSRQPWLEINEAPIKTA